MAGTTTYYGVTYPTSTDYVKDGATAIQTVATGFDSAVAIPTYNAQTGATYTFALTDVGKTVTASNASASTYTIPPTASVAWPTGTTLEITNLGAGVVTFAAGAGVTVTNTASTLAQYASAALIRTGLNAWTVTPRSGGSSGFTLIKAQTIGSAVSSVNVTGAFSAAYENYRVIVSGCVGSAVGLFGLKLGATATGYYQAVNSLTYAGAGASAAVSNGASFTRTGITSTNSAVMDFNLQNPFTAKYTILNGANMDSRTTGEGGFFAGFLDNTTSYSDFTITPASGTLTGGTIYVYGYGVI